MMIIKTMIKMTKNRPPMAAPRITPKSAPVTDHSALHDKRKKVSGAIPTIHTIYPYFTNHKQTHRLAKGRGGQGGGGGKK